MSTNIPQLLLTLSAVIAVAVLALFAGEPLVAGSSAKSVITAPTRTLK